jgi:predicted RNA-binding protein YlqC (UPF0109 family)
MLADHPELVVVSEGEHGRQRVVRLSVAPQDMGRVIGRDGRVANAIRTVLAAVPGGERWGLEIVD